MSGTSAWMRTAAFSPARWQRAHSSGTLRAKVGEVGSRLLWVAWWLWQSRQTGASGSLWAESLPWMLFWYCSTWAAWQTLQSTFDLIVSQARSRDGLASLWHWAQPMRAWVELS